MVRPDPIRVSYVRGFIKLSLWYVHKVLREEQADDFAEVVNTLVNIYRNTAFYDGRHHPAHGDADPAWAEVLNGLEAVYDRHCDDPTEFEMEGLALLWPHLEARLRQSSRNDGEERPYECWTYDYRREDRLSIHIYNVYQPRSPLSEMWIPFSTSLYRLLRDSQLRRPEVKIVRCGSWLNSVPPFQALFPKSWLESGQVYSQVRYTAGYWGQFTDRRGDFHARNGALFRATGAFPFPCMICECCIEEVLAHLACSFPETMVYNAERGYVLRI